MKNKAIKKIISVSSIIVFSIGYCLGMGAAGYNIASAQERGIASDYYGPYYLDRDRQSPYWLNIISMENVVFRGQYDGYGMIACSNIDPNNISFSPNEFYIGADNFHFEFRNWAKLIGDGYVPQAGRFDLNGAIGIDRRDGWLKKARISLNYYVLMRL